MISPKNEKCGKPVLLRWMFEHSGKKLLRPGNFSILLKCLKQYSERGHLLLSLRNVSCISLKTNYVTLARVLHFILLSYNFEDE